MKLAFIVAVLSVFAYTAAGALEPVITPICTIGMRVEPRGAAWPLVCIDGTPYYLVGRERAAGDAPADWPWRSHEMCQYFEMAGIQFDNRSKKFGGGDTTLKNLGAGDFNEEYTKFVPDQEIPLADRPPAGYLTADYTAEPPSVKLQKSPGKFSTWKVRRGEQDGDWYVGSVDETGKAAWLSIASKPEAVVAGRDGKHISEFRRAVLSYDSKRAFRIVIQNDGP